MLVPVTLHKAEKYAVSTRFMQENDSVRSFFMQNFGCARKVYNLYVDFLYKYLEKTGYTGGTQLPSIKIPEVSAFKKQYPFLKEADSLGLANVKIHFQEALRRFNQEYDHKTYTKRALRRDRSGTEKLSFRGLKGMPRFHAKARGYFSYKTNCQYPGEGSSLKNPTIQLKGNLLYLPKCRTGIPLVLHRSMPSDAKIGNVTVSMDAEGKFSASIEYSYTEMIDYSIRAAVTSGDRESLDKLRFLGLDYSQENFYVDSEGRKANYPHYYRKAEGKLARLQRQLSHMKKGSSNYEAQKEKISILHKKVVNQRIDYLRKQALLLTSGYDVIAVEDIDLRAMGSTRKLGKKLHDNGFGIFRNILARKLQEKGSILVKVDRWYASSRICSCCGCSKEDLQVKDREWDCPFCGVHHDRDCNAAVNICREGRRIFIPSYLKWMEEDEAARARAAALGSARHRRRTA